MSLQRMLTLTRVPRHPEALYDQSLYYSLQWWVKPTYLGPILRSRAKDWLHRIKILCLEAYVAKLLLIL